MTGHSIGSGHLCHVRKLEGRQPISDQQLAELMRKGWWNTQIRQKYKVGIARLRAVRRAVI